MNAPSARGLAGIAPAWPSAYRPRRARISSSSFPAEGSDLLEVLGLPRRLPCEKLCDETRALLSGPLQPPTEDSLCSSCTNALGMHSKTHFMSFRDIEFV
jgi:hypothetical protein